MNELEEKTKRIMDMLAKEDLGGVLINAQHNFAWFTGGKTNGVDQSRDLGSATLFIRRDGKRFLLANRIEMPRLLAEELNEKDYEPVEFSWEDEKGKPDFILERALLLVESKTSVIGSDVAVDGARMIEGLLTRLRYQLTDEELVRYRSLGRDAGLAVGNFIRNVKPGLTEREVARQAVSALAEYGIRSVVTLVAGDDRLDNFRHPVPIDRRWEKRLMVVAGCRRNGLTVSLTRIVSTGKISDELDRRTKATAWVNAHLWAGTKPGTSGRNLYEIASNAYKEVGFPGEEHLHHQGGACGYRSRDWLAHPGCEEIVHNKQAFAWNPSITGTKTEETCIAFDNKIEVITTSPDWPMIKIEVVDQEFQLPGILAI
jgi:Xaa-Pro aminopeptidase